MRNYFNWDVGLGFCFSILGAFLLSRGWTMPGGTGGVPGPGFFPVLVGAFLLLLGLGLAIRSVGTAPDYWTRGWWDSAMGRIFGIVGTCVVYLLLWQEIPFVVGTTALLLIIYLMLGLSWQRAVLLAAGFTVVLYGIFQWMFNIRF